jgi:hypothetical protein
MIIKNVTEAMFRFKINDQIIEVKGGASIDLDEKEAKEILDGYPKAFEVTEVVKVKASEKPAEEQKAKVETKPKAKGKQQDVDAQG